MADNNTVARPYAQAVFDIAKEAGDLGKWSDSLAIAGQLMADTGLLSTSAIRSSTTSSVSSF